MIAIIENERHSLGPRLSQQLFVYNIEKLILQPIRTL
jgi:hypothetical protein